LPPSGFDPSAAQQSAAFERLDRRLQRWIWERNWTELRDIQEATIHAVLDDAKDLIISAATASGKTEAAFLPICSCLVTETAESIRALYISPLKALINDQCDRLDGLCEYLEIPVHRWHGDVGSNRKSALLTHPSGILLITPESLEALFVRHGPEIGRLFAQLAYVVVDELHSFIGTERGRQLQSLLHRIEVILQRQVPRIGLSATLSEMPLVADFLRPGHGEQVTIIESQAEGQELKIQLRGYDLVPSSESETVPTQIIQHLFHTLCGSDNLIFPNRRQAVETYADKLRELCETQNRPNVFIPHHGNLSKALREEAEARLKDKTVPVNLICTTTLEMGIDVGSVQSIAQIGVPPSVASLRQRVGRSGRRGDPAVLRVYIAEPELRDDSHPQDSLRVELVQAIAIVRLLIQRWCEPPPPAALHPSTLVQQTLSLIAQYNGATAWELWRILCHLGPFAGIDQSMFAKVLRSLATSDLIMQSPDGTLLLGQRGERIVNNYHFYAVFSTEEEYRLISEGKPLGTLPLRASLQMGHILIFAGRRWKVVSVDHQRKEASLRPASDGKVPQFFGDKFPVHARIHQEMLRLYTSKEVPIFLDGRAKEFLEESRSNFARFGLATCPLLPYNDGILLFCWDGDRARQTLIEQLRRSGLTVSDEGLAILCREISLEEVKKILRLLFEVGPPNTKELAMQLSKPHEKYDGYLPDDLLWADYKGKYLNSEGAWQILKRLSALF
jgi:ATP-dependent helicase Lhr and Lhr-like helicase